MDAKSEIPVRQNFEVKLSVINEVLSQYQNLSDENQETNIITELKKFKDSLIIEFRYEVSDQGEESEYILSSVDILQLAKILFSAELEKGSIGHKIAADLIKKIHFDEIKDIYLYIDSIVKKRNSEKLDFDYFNNNDRLIVSLVEINPEWFFRIMEHRENIKEIYLIFQYAEAAGYEYWLNYSKNLILYAKEAIVIHDKLKSMGFLIDREVFIGIERVIKFPKYRENILSLIEKLHEENLLSGTDLSGRFSEQNSVTLICNSGKQVDVIGSILDNLKNFVPLNKGIVLAVCCWIKKLEEDDFLNLPSSHAAKDEIFFIIDKLNKLNCLSQNIVLAIIQNESNLEIFESAFLKLIEMDIFSENTMFAVCQSLVYFLYTKELLDVFEYMQKNNVFSCEEFAKIICQNVEAIKFIFSALQDNDDRRQLKTDNYYYIFLYAHRVFKIYNSLDLELMDNSGKSFQDVIFGICKNLKYFEEISFILENLKKYDVMLEMNVFLYYKNIKVILVKLEHFNISVSHQLLTTICQNAEFGKNILLAIQDENLHKKSFLYETMALLICQHGKYARDIVQAYLCLDYAGIFTADNQSIIDQNIPIAKEIAEILMRLKFYGLLNQYEEIPLDNNSSNQQQVPLKNRIIQKLQENPELAPTMLSLFTTLPLNKFSYIKICENSAYADELNVLCLTLEGLGLLDKEVATAVLNTVEHISELSSLVADCSAEGTLSKYQILKICRNLKPPSVNSSQYRGVMWRQDDMKPEESKGTRHTYSPGLGKL